MSKNPVPFRIVKDNSYVRDPNGGTSRQHQSLRKTTAEEMRLKKFEKVICRFFEKNGLLVTEENWSVLPDALREEWNAAIESARSEILE